MKHETLAGLVVRPVRRPRGSVPLWLCLVLFLSCFSQFATGQWLDYPSPGIPRTPDGKPNLTAYFRSSAGAAEDQRRKPAWHKSNVGLPKTRRSESQVVDSVFGREHVLGNLASRKTASPGFLRGTFSLPDPVRLRVQAIGPPVTKSIASRCPAKNRARSWPDKQRRANGESVYQFSLRMPEISYRCASSARLRSIWFRLRVIQ